MYCVLKAVFLLTVAADIDGVSATEFKWRLICLKGDHEWWDLRIMLKLNLNMYCMSL